MSHKVRLMEWIPHYSRLRPKSQIASKVSTTTVIAGSISLLSKALLDASLAAAVTAAAEAEKEAEPPPEE